MQLVQLQRYYSLRPIILFTNIDVSKHILVVDTSVFAKSNMGRREYIIITASTKEKLAYHKNVKH
jgi:hypothetical protein